MNAAHDNAAQQMVPPGRQQQSDHTDTVALDGQEPAESVETEGCEYLFLCSPLCTLLCEGESVF